MKFCKPLAALLGTLMLIGCGSAASSGVSSTSQEIYENLGVPSSIQITTTSFFNNHDDGITTVEERKEWTDSISERYQTDLTIVVPADESIYQTTYETAYTGELTGILELNSYTELRYLVEAGRLLPLDDYLANNKAWQMLPEQMRRLYQIDGKTYGVPSCFYYTMRTRSYETELLEAAGLSAPPATPEEFKAFAEKLINEEIIPEYQSVIGGGGAGMAWATDFLNAFGVYTDLAGQIPYAYNPDSDAVTDALLSDNALLALQYLRDLYQLGAINWDFDVLDATDYVENIKAGMYATYYGPASQGKYDFGITAAANRIYNSTKEWPDADEDWAELTSFFTESYTMTGNGTAGTQLLYPMSTPYVLLAGTAQPAEVINFFVDLLYASEDNYLESYVGLADNYVRNADGTIQLKMILSQDSSVDFGEEVYISRHQAGLVDKVEGLYPNAQVFIATVKDAGALAHEREIYDYTNQKLSEAIISRAAVKMSGSYSAVQSQFLIQNYAKVNELFFTCCKEAIMNPDTTVQQELTTYRNAMRALGADQILTEANQAIGKPNPQTY